MSLCTWYAHIDTDKRPKKEKCLEISSCALFSRLFTCFFTFRMHVHRKQQPCMVHHLKRRYDLMYLLSMPQKCTSKRICAVKAAHTQHTHELHDRNLNGVWFTMKNLRIKLHRQRNINFVQRHSDKKKLVFSFFRNAHNMHKRNSLDLGDDPSRRHIKWANRWDANLISTFSRSNDRCWCRCLS